MLYSSTINDDGGEEVLLICFVGLKWRMGERWSWRIGGPLRSIETRTAIVRLKKSILCDRRYYAAVSKRVVGDGLSFFTVFGGRRARTWSYCTELLRYKKLYGTRVQACIER